MKLLPLNANVMFRFLDDTGGAKGKFTERKIGSILLPTLDSEQKHPRWGVVVTSGPESQVVKGEYILIAALRWSFGTEFEGEKIWKTDDTEIMMVTDDLDVTARTSF